MPARFRCSQRMERTSRPAIVGRLSMSIWRNSSPRRGSGPGAIGVRVVRTVRSIEARPPGSLTVYHGGLGGGIVAVLRMRLERVNGSDVDDPTTAVRTHMGDRGHRHVVDAANVHAQRSRRRRCEGFRSSLKAYHRCVHLPMSPVCLLTQKGGQSFSIWPPVWFDGTRTGSSKASAGVHASALFSKLAAKEVEIASFVGLCSTWSR